MSDTPAGYNSANPAHIKSRKRKDERDKDRDDTARRWVMSDPRGRHFVWLILSEAGMFKQAFTGTSKTDFNCGRADVGLKLHTELSEQFPNEYVLAWHEHLKLEEQDRKVDEAARVEPNGAEKQEDAEV